MEDKSYFQVLPLLLKAPSKEAVLNLCHVAFAHRGNADPPTSIIATASATFSIEAAEAKQLLTCLGRFLKDAVFVSCTEPQDVAALFPDGFHKNLRDLLVKIVVQNQPSWRAVLQKSQVSLPQLVDFGWHVRVSSLTNSSTKLSAPSCVLELQIHDKNEARSADVLNHKSVQMELTKETLDTMLDGLSKIRDQLSSVASRT